MAIYAKTYHPSAKTIELIIYISSKLKDKPKYGATQLGKALCLTDVVSYLKAGQQVTDLTYIKQEFGPTPNPRQFLPTRNFLIENGDAELIEVPYFGLMQAKLIPKRAANIELFTKEEIILIDEVIESISDQNAVDISNYTHRFLAWNFAEDKEELPLFSFLLTSADPETKDLEWAEESIKAYEESLKKEK